MAQVLNGSAHLSLEQAEAVNEFFGHSEEEAEFFSVLVQWARAGTPKLRQRFERKRRALLESRLLLKNRLGVKENLTQEQQLIYYSYWIYSAIHVVASVPGFQQKKRMLRAALL